MVNVYVFICAPCCFLARVYFVLTGRKTPTFLLYFVLFTDLYAH